MRLWCGFLRTGMLLWCSGDRDKCDAIPGFSPNFCTYTVKTPTTLFLYCSPPSTCRALYSGIRAGPQGQSGKPTPRLSAWPVLHEGQIQ